MYTYGPVPSRRLGRSLGVSPIPPKTCSYTCVYCQLGRTDHLQVRRESFFPKQEILSEIVQHAGEAKPDYVTFVGDGEPTLCADLGWLLRQTKDKTGLPVAVITNGSLLWQEEVRRELSAADVVIPTIDAGNETTFRRINRPHHDITFANMLQGLVDFSSENSCSLWLEVMLVSGVNDSTDELMSIKQAIDAIMPDKVYILTPIRPPAEAWVKPPSAEKLIEAQKIIGQATAIAGRESGDFGLGAFRNVEEAVMEIGSRHPLRLSQAKALESRYQESGAIEHMLSTGTIVRVEYGGETYVLPGRFLRGS